MSAHRRGARRNLGFMCLLAVLVAACAAPMRKADQTSLARQSTREEILSAQGRWGLDGRLAVSNARDGGSGSLDWSQDGDHYRFVVQAPVTGKTWVLSGGASHAQLEGLHAQPVEDRDAATLLRRELGWIVPLPALIDWVRGMRAPGAATLLFDADGLPAQIDQDGWEIRFLDYDTGVTPALPRKIFASKGDYRVRLVVHHWRAR